MSPHVIDVLVLVLFSGFAFGGAVLGVLALPWSDAELEETNEALRTGLGRVDAALGRVLARIQAEPPAPVHLVERPVEARR